MSRFINHNNAIPKYFQLASILKSQIDEGEWKPRQSIPSERQLELQYKVSRPTVRQAIEYLEKLGYIYREHGRGTFVSPQKLQKKMLELTSFSEDLLRKGIQPSQIICSINHVVPSEKILSRLELPLESSVLRIERIRLGDEIPIGLQISYVVLGDDQQIDEDDLQQYGSLYRVMEEKLNIIPTEADETLEVTLATPEEATLLQVKAGAPLLLNERLTYDQNRKPVEFVKILYRGDRYQYIIRLTR
ncbi:MAG: phosphonate metabolism transcriptional regulator PhnF [Chloroflexi bacterium HGW-Chloroflexi-2]|jgi:GntR family transcriptional regulator|nr:MAG: phosphonate metabolism transcriptional regulator PhnF [Chloroflexi bacterium HGW-Chloroflexi-2]